MEQTENGCVSSGLSGQELTMHKRDAYLEVVDSSRPLCCRYLVVVLDALTVQIEDADGVLQKCLFWAFGALADGQHEVLGLWVRPDSDVSALAAVSEDLEDRGVTRIRMTLGAGNEWPGLAFSGIGVLPALAESADLGGLPARTRRRADEGLRIAQQMHTKAAQAIQRRGSFPDALAAASYVGHALARAQCGLARRASDRRGRTSGHGLTSAASPNVGVGELVG